MTESTLQSQSVGPRSKIGFVCSGGATKAAAFHVGVAMALQQQGFRFSGGVKNSTPKSESKPGEISLYVGSSAGSVVSTYLAGGYPLEEIFDSFLKRKTPKNSKRRLPPITYQKMFALRGSALDNAKNFGRIKSLARALGGGEWASLMKFEWLQLSGFFSTVGMEKYIREEVLSANSFEDLEAELFIVATQLNHSRKVVFGKYQYDPPPHDPSCRFQNNVPISEAVAASTALPPVFSPYAMKVPDESEVSWFIDGEIRETLSTHVAVDAGADLVFASYTHQPYHHVDDKGSLTQYGLPSIVAQSLYLLIEQKINNSRHNKIKERDAILAVEQYCEKQGISADQRKEIRGIMEQRLHHRTDVDVIYIHPDPKDYEMFFAQHFTLSPKRLRSISQSGFRAAQKVLSDFDWSETLGRKSES